MPPRRHKTPPPAKCHLSQIIIVYTLVDALLLLASVDFLPHIYPAAVHTHTHAHDAKTSFPPHVYTLYTCGLCTYDIFEGDELT